MAELSLQQLAEKMQGIDFSMLSTIDSEGVSARPMSNNGDVEYDGDAWFFTYEDSGKVRQIKANDNVSCTYQGKGRGEAPGVFISVEGKAEILTDRAVLEEHWYDALERWFPDGLDTKGIAMLKVHASLIRWWDGEDGGELTVK